MLFSSSQRNDPHPRHYSESSFACLDRRSGQDYDRIRVLLEDWFSNIPDDSQQEIQTRLCSGNDWEFHSVFLELYVHELLLCLNHSVEFHPTLQHTAKKPDFIASAVGSPTAYVECVVVTETSTEQRGTHALVNALYDSIDKISCPDYFLSLDSSGVPKTPIPIKAWRTQIQEWVNSLDYDKVLKLGQQGFFEELPAIELVHDGFELRVQPIAKKQSARGRQGVRPIGAQSSDGCSVTSRYSIRDALRGKATRYGKLGAPYIVVVNCLGEQCDLEEIEEAIYGREGLWRVGGNGTPTRLSAVIAIHHLLPWSVSRADIRLFHNPHAAYPYEGSLNQLPHATSSGSEVTLTDGTHPRFAFGLNSEWPMSRTNNASDERTTLSGA